MKQVVVTAIALMAIAAPARAADIAAQLNAQELARVQAPAPPPMVAPMPPPVPVMAPPPAYASACPPGRVFVPEGYTRRGKWRPARCAWRR